MRLLNTVINRFRLFFPRASAPSDKNAEPGPLEKILEYRFCNPQLLTQALTHKSFIASDEKREIESNERMEFLGDAVLNCLVSHYLFETYQDRMEGQLSKIKSLVVSRKIVGELALSIGLERFVLLGPSERKSGEVRRSSILSNTFEAVIGAVYLDGGLKPCRHILEKVLFCRIEEFFADSNNVNYKSELLEYSQRDGFGIPHYTVIATAGPEHNKTFKVRVDIAGVVLGEGSGPNKKDAEQIAAQNAKSQYTKEKILKHKQGEKSNELVSY